MTKEQKDILIKVGYALAVIVGLVGLYFLFKNIFKSDKDKSDAATKSDLEKDLKKANSQTDDAGVRSGYVSKQLLSDSEIDDISNVILISASSLNNSLADTNSVTQAAQKVLTDGDMLALQHKFLSFGKGTLGEYLDNNGLRAAFELGIAQGQNENPDKNYGITITY